MIVLSAFGHKLSHYDRHAASSLRIQVVKLWSEPRKALVTTTARLRATVSRLLGSYAFLLPIQRFPRLGRTVAWILPVSRRGVAYFGFPDPIPLSTLRWFLPGLVGAAVPCPSKRRCSAFSYELYLEALFQWKSTLCISFGFCP